MWANCSSRSEEMSNHEQITQVAQDKWATVSHSLRVLMINEWMSDSLKKIWQKNLKSYFLVCFLKVFYLKKWAICSFPLFWWAMSMWANRSGRSSKISDLLRLLRGNERLWAYCSPKMSEWANRSFFWANCYFAHFWAKNEQFARKTDERIFSPAK